MKENSYYYLEVFCLEGAGCVSRLSVSSVPCMSRIHEAEGKFKGIHQHFVPQVLTSQQADLHFPFLEYSYSLFYAECLGFIVVLSERNRDKCLTLQVPMAGMSPPAGRDRSAKEFLAPEPSTKDGQELADEYPRVLSPGCPEA